MAVTITDINAYTHNYIVPLCTDVVFKRSPVFTRLRTQRAERFAGGLKIVRPIIYQALNGAAIARGETWSLAYVTTETALTLDMKVYRVDIVLYGWDAMLNRGPLAIFNQVELKFANASMKMAEMLATDMYKEDYTSGRSKMLTGFDRWYDDGNTYADVGGLARSDVPGLKAYTATLTDPTLEDFQIAYGSATIGPDHPDLICCTQAAYNLIWAAKEPAQRYMNEKGDLAQVGFESFRFNAADVVVDNYLPTSDGTNPGYVFGLNTEYVEWYFSDHELFQFGFTGFKVAQNSIDVAGQFLVGSNIVVPNPRTGFKLKSLKF